MKTLLPFSLLLAVLFMSGCGKVPKNTVTIKTEGYCEVSSSQDDEMWCTKGWKYTREIPVQTFLQMLADQYVYEEGKTETTSTPARLLRK